MPMIEEPYNPYKTPIDPYLVKYCIRINYYYGPYQVAQKDCPRENVTFIGGDTFQEMLENFSQYIKHRFTLDENTLKQTEKNQIVCTLDIRESTAQDKQSPQKYATFVKGSRKKYIKNISTCKQSRKQADKLNRPLKYYDSKD